MKRSDVRIRHEIESSLHSSQDKIRTMKCLSLFIAMKVFGTGLSLAAPVQAVMLTQLEVKGNAE